MTTTVAGVTLIIMLSWQPRDADAQLSICTVSKKLPTLYVMYLCM